MSGLFCFWNVEKTELWVRPGWNVIFRRSGTLVLDLEQKCGCHWNLRGNM